MSTFKGFSEDDLAKIKSKGTSKDMPGKQQVKTAFSFKLAKTKKYTHPAKPDIDEKAPEILSDNYKLSIPNKILDSLIDEGPNRTELVEKSSNLDIVDNTNVVNETVDLDRTDLENGNHVESVEKISIDKSTVESSSNDSNGRVDGLKLQELQLQQRIMEEQNRKRKEMLAKALADRTKQTVEQAQKLNKIKKELQVLDGQFSQDVAMLRKKIDQACLTYADAEKHYLKIEREFLDAKLKLQKEKDKKELLSEHLCALITHNETKKAQKLENLMCQLALDEGSENNNTLDKGSDNVIVDGVDERTGKMVDIDLDSLTS